MLLGIFAGVALVLAGVGIYGVTSYGVAQRTHEIGIRLALGASGERVLREVVARGVRLTLIAVAIGLVGAVAMGRLASAVLFGVTPIDPVALAGSRAGPRCGLDRRQLYSRPPRVARRSRWSRWRRNRTEIVRRSSFDEVLVRGSTSNAEPTANVEPRTAMIGGMTPITPYTPTSIPVNRSPRCATPPPASGR